MSDTEQTEHSAPNRTGRMAEVPIGEVVPSALNPRKRIAEDSLQELAESIREHGILEPLVVRPKSWAHVSQTGDILVAVRERWEIIAGERRWRAARIAGLDSVPVVIRDGEGIEDRVALQLMLVENLQREDLDPIETAEGYRRFGGLGHRQAEIAAMVKKSQPTIANALRLLDLPESVQARIRSGELSGSHGVALASYKCNRHVQEVLAEQAVKGGWPTKKLEGYFGATSWLDAELRQYVCELRSGLGWNWEGECRGACPHDAYRAAQREYMGWCLRPACYEGKRKAAKEAQEAAAAAKVQEARASGSTLVKARDLGMDGDDYKTIYPTTKLPPGCQTGCPKRIRALDGVGAEKEICSDPKCWKRLEMAATKASNKAQRSKAKTMLGDIDRAIAAIGECGAREMGVIAALATSDYQFGGKVLEAAMARHEFTNREQSAIRNARWGADGKSFGWNRYQVLAEISPTVLASVILEVAMRREAENLAANPQGALTPIADWYLEVATEKEKSQPVAAGDAGDLEAEECRQCLLEGRIMADSCGDGCQHTGEGMEICQLAGLPCDPPTCVQRCPKAEAAQAEPALPKPDSSAICWRPAHLALLFALGDTRKTEFACDLHSDQAKASSERDGWQLLRVDQVPAAGQGAIRCRVLLSDREVADARTA